MVHTCPKCELKFPTQPELATHVETDHEVKDAAKWGQDRYVIEGRDIPPLYPEPEPDRDG